MADKVAVKNWRSILKKTRLNNETVTAEIFGKYAEVRDPYWFLDLPEEWCREYWACSPDGKMWVCLGDLPAKVCRKLLKKHKSKLAFSAGQKEVI